MFKIASHLLLVFIFLLGHSYANTFNKINVTGNERISKETILVLSNLKTGMNYDDEQLNQSFKLIRVLIKNISFLKLIFFSKKRFTK